MSILLTMKRAAIITAGGIGKRMGGDIPKQFIKIWGRPIILHTLEAFDASASIDLIVVTSPSAWLEETRNLIASAELSKDWFVVEGGERRQDSVANGVYALPSDVEVVVIHDAVRPFVETRLIDMCVEIALSEGACIAAIPVVDTIKVSHGGVYIDETPDRSKLWHAQTPQAFRAHLLRRAIDEARRLGISATDEAMLVERLGAKVRIIMGSPKNIKITVPWDIDIAQAIMGDEGCLSE